MCNCLPSHSNKIQFGDVKYKVASRGELPFSLNLLENVSKNVDRTFLLLTYVLGQVFNLGRVENFTASLCLRLLLVVLVVLVVELPSIQTSCWVGFVYNLSFSSRNFWSKMVPLSLVVMTKDYLLLQATMLILFLLSATLSCLVQSSHWI